MGVRMEDTYLENLQIGIRENKDKLTLKELNELYGEDYIPPYFVVNYGGRIYPFSEFWKQKLIQLDSFIGAERKKKEKEIRLYPQGCSRTWRNNQINHDKILLNQIFKEENQ